MYLDNEMQIEVKLPEEKPAEIMSSVTFFKNPQNATVTADWNGNLDRGYASPPCTTSLNGREIIFTRDQKTGGSWFSVNDDGTMAVLLNNNADEHKRKANYLKSCSLIMMDIISATSPLDTFAALHLQFIEAFSMILYFGNNLCELIWDGNERLINNSNCIEPQIWGPISKNKDESQIARKMLFDDFIVGDSYPSADAIRALHGKLCGGSHISQAVLSNNVILVYHKDALEGKFYIMALPIKNRPFINH